MDRVYPMLLKLFQHSRQATIKCPHCHKDIRELETRLFIGDHPFHRNCWVRGIMGPAENYDRGMTMRKDATLSERGKRLST